MRSDLIISKVSACSGCHRRASVFNGYLSSYSERSQEKVCKNCKWQYCRTPCPGVQGRIRTFSLSGNTRDLSPAAEEASAGQGHRRRMQQTGAVWLQMAAWQLCCSRRCAVSQSHCFSLMKVFFFTNFQIGDSCWPWIGANDHRQTSNIQTKRKKDERNKNHFIYYLGGK